MKLKLIANGRAIKVIAELMPGNMCNNPRDSLSFKYKVIED